MKSSLLGLVIAGLFSTALFAEVVDHPTEILVAFKKGASLEKSNLSFYKSVKELDFDADHRGGI